MERPLLKNKLPVLTQRKDTQSSLKVLLKERCDAQQFEAFKALYPELSFDPISGHTGCKILDKMTDIKNMSPKPSTLMQTTNTYLNGFLDHKSYKPSTSLRMWNVLTHHLEKAFSSVNREAALVVIAREMEAIARLAYVKFQDEKKTGGLMKVISEPGCGVTTQHSALIYSVRYNVEGSMVARLAEAQPCQYCYRYDLPRADYWMHKNQDGCFPFCTCKYHQKEKFKDLRPLYVNVIEYKLYGNIQVVRFKCHQRRLKQGKPKWDSLVSKHSLGSGDDMTGCFSSDESCTGVNGRRAYVAMLWRIGRRPIPAENNISLFVKSSESCSTHQWKTLVPRTSLARTIAKNLVMRLQVKKLDGNFAPEPGYYVFCSRCNCFAHRLDAALEVCESGM